MKTKYLLFAVLIGAGSLSSSTWAQQTIVENAAKVTEAEKAAPIKTVSAKKWLAGAQKLARGYKVGETKAQTDLTRSNLISELGELTEGVEVKFRSKVGTVNWKDGVASVTVEYEFENKINNRAPLRISRNRPFELTMTQLEAVAIKPGDKFEFVGQLEFHARKWGAVGVSTSSQQMYSFRHEYLAGGYLGTFTTTNFQCKLNGKSVQPRWAEAEPENDE